MSVSQGQDLGQAGGGQGEDTGVQTPVERTIGEFIRLRNAGQPVDGPEPGSEGSGDAEAALAGQVAGEGASGAPAGNQTGQGTHPAASVDVISLDEHRKVITEREAAERTAEYWRGVAEGRIKLNDQPAAPAAPAPKAPPNLADFGDDTAGYTAAVLAWAKEELRGDTAETVNEVLDQRDTATKQQEAERAFVAKVGNDPAIIAIATDPTLTVSESMLGAIRLSEDPAGVIKWLGANRAEAKRIFDMAPTMVAPDGRIVRLGGNPAASMYEMGRIAASIAPAQGQTGQAAQPAGQPATQTGKGKRSAAPPPADTVAGTGTGAIEGGDEKVPIEEFVRRRNEKQYGKGR